MFDTTENVCAEIARLSHSNAQDLHNFIKTVRTPFGKRLRKIFNERMAAPPPNDDNAIVTCIVECALQTLFEKNAITPLESLSVAHLFSTTIEDMVGLLGLNFVNVNNCKFAQQWFTELFSRIPEDVTHQALHVRRSVFTPFLKELLQTAANDAFVVRQARVLLAETTNATEIQSHQLRKM